MLSRIRAFLQSEPAITAWALNGGIAMLVAYAFHWDHTWQAAAATIVTAVATIVSAVLARPAHIQVVTGGLATIITAAATFGLHVSPHAEAMILAGASIALGYLFRQNITPVTAVRNLRAPERQRL